MKKTASGLLVFAFAITVSTTVTNYAFAQATTTSETSSFVSESITRTCKISANATTVSNGSSVTLSWQTQGFAKVTINGETMSDLTGSKTFSNITVNTTYNLVAETADGSSKCTANVTVACLPPVVIPAPTCVLDPVTKTINSGENTNLTWTTTNAKSVTLTDFSTVELNGNRNTGALTANKSYTLTVVGNNDQTITCTSNITVNPPVVDKPVPPTCPYNSQANRTIVTFSDPWLLSDREVEATYTEIKPVNLVAGKYDVTLVSWDGYNSRVTTSQPNEAYFLNLTGANGFSKNSNPTTDLADMVREANFNGKVNTGLVVESAITGLQAKHKVAGDKTSPNSVYAVCAVLDLIPETPNPVPPVCPLTPKANRTIVTFSDPWLLSDREVEATYTEIKPVNLVAGKYDVTLVSWDGYNSRVTTSQPNESYFLRMHGASGVLANSNPTTDLADNVREALVNEKVNSNLVVASTTTGLQGIHKVAGDKTSPNSVHALCAAVDLIPEVTVDPICESFTVSTSTIVKGASAKLTWTTKNASRVTIDNAIGEVALNGNMDVSPISNITYLLTVFGTGDKRHTCNVSLKVETPVIPTPISCASNVTFISDKGTVDEGESATLTWTTTGITSLSFSNGITSTALSGSAIVTPTSATTYTMTATNGTSTISCPVSVSVDTDNGGGGGGGSSSPRCELEVSKKSIKLGEKVTLTWDTTRARDIILTESKSKVLLTTEKMSTKDKEQYFDDTMVVSPKADTVYTLTVKRGSKERTCKVSVDVKDDVIVKEDRNQKPLVSGISLNDVPYTGFAAGPILTLLFYVILLAWALYLAYVLVIRRDAVGSYLTVSSHADHLPKVTPEAIRPDVFVSVQTPVASVVVPSNLPTANIVGGYAGVDFTVAPVANTISESDMAEIENQAHDSHVLLSTDAVHFFVSTTKSKEERISALNEVMKLAKDKYPNEDGWVVLNENRMRELCTLCQANDLAKTDVTFAPVNLPNANGSLAEAIAQGNVVAAYEMIGHRPMFALASAASDFDALYRLRRGETVVVSNLLMEATKSFTDVQLQNIINALTSALDGTYTDEASAVKMAIMKAVKVVA